MADSVFPGWGKTERISRIMMAITEKIDGTNALVQITDGYTYRPGEIQLQLEDKHYGIRAGSRTRWLEAGGKADNFGFAAWVKEHAEELLRLGYGRHYGEWWGAGIQRTYNQSERFFSLFNSHYRPADSLPSCVRQVPLMYQGELDMSAIDNQMETLRVAGSAAAPGFMNPEGVIIWIKGERFKKTFEAGPKGQKAAA